MSTEISASLLITFAVVQTIVFLLLIRFLDLYEREPLSVLAVMVLWGAVGATALASAGNAVSRDLLPADVADVFGRAVYAPVVEEGAKGIALVAFVIVSLKARGRLGIPRFEGITDGIVYGAAVGLGFAFTEDLLYLLVNASRFGLEEGVGTFLARRDISGVSLLHHAIYTGAFGVGLGLATWTRSKILKFAFPAGGLFVAVLFHAFNNGWTRFVLVSRFGFEETTSFVRQEIAAPEMIEAERSAGVFLRWADFLLIAMFLGLAALWLRYQRRVIREELKEEAVAGLITNTELELLPLYWRRTFWYWQLVRSGQWERWRLLKRIHNELVDLAFLKRRWRRGKGDERAVHQARALIVRLKAQKMVFL